MQEGSFMLSRMFCANSSDQSLIIIWIPTAPVACRYGPAANASDESAPAALPAGVKSVIFNQFLETTLLRRLRDGTIGQGY
jgi:hypothetical protein